MPENGPVILAVVLSALAVFFATTAIVTRNTVSLQKSFDAFTHDMQESLDANIHTDLVTLKDRLTAMHGSAER